MTRRQALVLARNKLNAAFATGNARMQDEAYQQQREQPRPIAWAVVCADGDVHRAGQDGKMSLLFFGAPKRWPSWSNKLRAQADKEGTCGPHRVVALGEVEDEQS